ncbi:MAG: hypothetical protein KJN80_05805 [Deltaproteobacteria bacterium]|nr:hypothetical protein [Deltaproteobacteria bacterium]
MKLNYGSKIVPVVGLSCCSKILFIRPRKAIFVEKWSKAVVATEVSNLSKEKYGNHYKSYLELAKSYQNSDPA